MKYQRKPVTVEAVQWKGDNLNEVYQALVKWGLEHEAKQLRKNKFSPYIYFGEFVDVGAWIVFHSNGISSGYYEVLCEKGFKDQFTPSLEDNN